MTKSVSMFRVTRGESADDSMHNSIHARDLQRSRSLLCALLLSDSEAITQQWFCVCLCICVRSCVLVCACLCMVAYAYDCVYDCVCACACM